MLSEEIHGIAQMLREEPGKIKLAALILDLIAGRVADMEAMHEPNPAPVVIRWGVEDENAWNMLNPHGGAR